MALNAHHAIGRTDPLKRNVGIGFQLADEDSQSFWITSRFRVRRLREHKTHARGGNGGKDIAHSRRFLTDDLCLQILPLLAFPILQPRPWLGAGHRGSANHLAVEVTHDQAGDFPWLGPFDSQIRWQIFCSHGPVTVEATVICPGRLVLRNRHDSRLPGTRSGIESKILCNGFGPPGRRDCSCQYSAKQDEPAQPMSCFHPKQSHSPFLR